MIRFGLIALFACLLALTAPASAAIVINEVESNAADGAGDWIELLNTGPGPVDISGYYAQDAGPNNTYTVPPATSITEGGFYVLEGDGLGGNDSATLFTAGAAQEDTYAWGTAASTTYGRCPDGTGALTTTASPTPKGANNCAGPIAGLTWPGGSTVSLADANGVFGPNLSGLAYQPSGSSAPGVLWAARNGPATLFRLIFDGTKWTPDTTNGWSAGKQLLYTTDDGVPDAEGVTLAGGDANGIFVSTERNDLGPAAEVSRPAVLRFDVSSPGTTLTATRDWDMTADFPATPDNKGLEAVAWVPDSLLVAKGFVEDGGATYNPANHPGHGTGLFFVGIELSGRIIAYALNQTNNSFTRVAEIVSGFPNVMSLDYEPETTHLWAACDDTCNGQTKTLDIAQSGPNDGKFVVSNTYERPAAGDNLNNEGFTIAPQAECVNGRKPVFWSDDSQTAGHALRPGTLNCTVLPGSDDDDDDDTGTGTTTTPGTTTPATTTPPPAVLPLPLPGLIPTRNVAPQVRTLGLRLSRATRRTGRLSYVIDLNELANLTVTATARRGTRGRARSILRTTRRGVTAGRKTIAVTLSRRVRRTLRRGDRVTLTIVARDAGGLATTRRVTARVP